jgi:hypothetical protein
MGRGVDQEWIRRIIDELGRKRESDREEVAEAETERAEENEKTKSKSKPESMSVDWNEKASETEVNVSTTSSGCKLIMRTGEWEILERRQGIVSQQQQRREGEDGQERGRERRMSRTTILLRRGPSTMLPVSQIIEDCTNKDRRKQQGGHPGKRAAAD